MFKIFEDCNFEYLLKDDSIISNLKSTTNEKFILNFSFHLYLKFAVTLYKYRCSRFPLQLIVYHVIETFRTFHYYSHTKHSEYYIIVLSVVYAARELNSKTIPENPPPPPPPPSACLKQI